MPLELLTEIGADYDKFSYGSGGVVANRTLAPFQMKYLKAIEIEKMR